jgi:subtilisin family serine protease
VRPISRLGGCLLATVLTAGAAYAAPAAAAPPMGNPETAELVAGDFGAARTLTLITGDRFLVSADGASVTKLPTPGREKVQFLTQRYQGHLEVMPTDAVDLVNRGTVDSRLFDVTTLLKLGYDDTRAGLPLIISYADGAAGEQKLRSSAAAADADVVHDLSSIDSLAIEQDRTQGAELWNALTTSSAAAGASAGVQTRSLKSEIRRVQLNGVRKLSLDESTKQIGAPTAWAKGLVGEGVPVGVVDTGVDDSHPDLAGRVVTQDFTGAGLKDEVGHATHVASTIAGTGAASGGRYRGVAPGAKIYSGKACTQHPDGFGCEDAAIIAAMEWMVKEQHVRVVNLSLGGENAPVEDALETAINKLTADYGTLFVVSAGNSGTAVPVSSPATAESALAVGAVDKSDALADFSSRGPRAERGVLKPEISAPGVDIMAAKAYGGGTDQPYWSMDGTSMAAPHVAGAAAILAQQHPTWRAAELKAALIASAKPLAKTSIYSAGSGRLDVARAITQTVTTSPATVNIDDNAPTGMGKTAGRTVTYRNTGTKAVTLKLAFGAMIRRAPKPTPAPKGMFTLSKSTITVPAGGKASVTVKVDARKANQSGLYGGDLTATGGKLVVQTPVGLDRQPLYKLTLNTVNRVGKPTLGARLIVAGLTNEYFGQNLVQPNPPRSTFTLLVPAGRYLVSATIMDFVGVTRLVSAITDPNLTVDRDVTIDLDARLAKSVALYVNKPDAVQTGGFLNFTTELTAGRGLAYGIGGPFDTVFSGRLGKTSQKHVQSMISSYFEPKKADGTIKDSPWTVAAAVVEPGILNGYSRILKDKELATVENDFAASSTNKSSVTKINYPSWPGFGRDMWGGATVMSLPNKRTDYYASEGGVKWDVEFNNSIAGGFDWAPDIMVPMHYMSDSENTYKAGKTYHESWNKGVFGPAFPAEAVGGQSGLNRVGDMLSLSATMWSDDQSRLGSASLVGQFGSLTRNGVVVFSGGVTGGQYQVPAGDAEYKFMINTGRKPLVTVSTGNQITWTFRSGTTPADKVSKLPVSVVRFYPELDDRNKAAAGDYDFIPFQVQRQPGATKATTSAFELQVSYDNGLTWVNPTISRFGESGVALVQRPAGKTSGLVSIKSKATLSDGGIVEQKIMSAIRF